MSTEHDELTFRSFTAREIADAIQNLGYKAKINIEENGDVFIRSSSSGVHWTIYLGQDDPFIEEMHFSTLIWTNDDAYEWASKWNSCHCWSMAHVHFPEASIDPELDIYEGCLMVASGHSFLGGVSHRFLENAVSRWIDEIEELSTQSNIATFSQRLLEGR